MEFKLGKTFYENETVVRSIPEFIEAVKILGGYLDEDGPPEALWYRGQNKTSYSLCPSATRFDPRWSFNKTIENIIFSEFIHKAMSAHRDQRDKNDRWYWHIIAQHYGLPTRLLDWTEGALISLFFALEGPIDNLTSPCVWVLNPYRMNELSTNKELIYFCDSITKDEDDIEILERYNFASDDLPVYPAAFIPAYVDSRIRAQKGCFTVFGSKKGGLEELAGKHTDKPFLGRIRISSGEQSIRDMKQHLSNLGVSDYDIYPDLEGLAAQLKWQHFPEKGRKKRASTR